MRTSRSRRGFALVEILVAITIVGIAVPGLMLRMQSIANTTMFIESRTVAYWIAENKLQELIIDQQLNRSSTKIRRDRDTLEYDDREWFWTVELIEVELPEILAPAKMYRVEIEVGLEDDNSDDKALASLSGFLHEE